MPRRFALLVNPVAGGGKANALAPRVLHRLRAGGLNVEPLVASDRQEASNAVRAAVDDGTDGVVVVGGDGSVNLGAQAVAGTRACLGIVPCGTGNDVARAARTAGTGCG